LAKLPVDALDLGIRAIVVRLVILRVASFQEEDLTVVGGEIGNRFLIKVRIVPIDEDELARKNVQKEVRRLFMLRPSLVLSDAANE
jgi:hypothetical protein